MTGFTFRLATLAWRLAAWTLFLIVVGWAHPSNAQTSDTPSLLQPVDEYRGTSGEISSELQQFRSSDFDAGNIAWTMAGALASLLIITPGLLLFYCGLLGIRNPTDVMVRYLGLVALLSIMWALWGYSLAFDRGVHSHDVLASERLTSETEWSFRDRLLGSTDHFGMRGLDSELGDDGPVYPLRRQNDKVPHMLLMTYQLMCFISVPVPLAVALSDRLTATGIAVFVVTWATIVYSPITYWVWGGGWHAAVLDTAGGVPVHVSVGFSVLAAAWMLRRTEHRQEVEEFANRFVFLGLGAALFWGGSMICNSSRSLSADGSAVNALTTTLLAGCAGLIGWVGIDWLARGKADLRGFCVGPSVGVMTIAAGCAYVAPQSSIIIGLFGGAIGCFAYGAIQRRYVGNGLLVVFALHAIGGVVGTLLTGVFATASVAGFDQEGNAIAGLIIGDPGRMARQAGAVISAATLAIVGTPVALIVVRIAGGTRPLETPANDVEHCA